MIRSILIGHGYLGKFHAEKFAQHQLSKLVAIIEPRAEEATRLQSLYPETQVFSRVEDCHLPYEAALICTPTAQHFSLCRWLLEQGKHVFVEKPMVRTSKEVDELKKLLKGQIFQVGHSERYQAIIPQIQEHVGNRNGCCLVMTRHAPFQNRAADVDVIDDLIIHDIDLAMHFFQSEPHQFFAWGQKSVTPFWDHVKVVAHWANGNMAVISAGRIFPNVERQCQVFSSQGNLEIDWAKSQWRKNEGEWQTYPKRDHLLLEQKDFFQSILQKKSIGVGLGEGGNAVGWCERFRQSLGPSL